MDIFFGYESLGLEIVWKILCACVIFHKRVLVSFYKILKGFLIIIKKLRAFLALGNVNVGYVSWLKSVILTGLDQAREILSRCLGWGTLGGWKVPFGEKRSARRKVGGMPKQNLTSLGILSSHLYLLFYIPEFVLVLYMTIHALHTIGFVGGSNYYCFKEKVSFERKLKKFIRLQSNSLFKFLFLFYIGVVDL